MPTKKHRYMIVLNEDEIEKLETLMQIMRTKQKSKAISLLINYYAIKTAEEIKQLIKEIIELE